VHEPVPDNGIQNKSDPGTCGGDFQECQRFSQRVAEKPDHNGAEHRNAYERAQSNEFDVPGTPETAGVDHPSVLGDHARNHRKEARRGPCHNGGIVIEEQGKLPAENEDQHHENAACHIGDAAGDLNVGGGKILSSCTKILPHKCRHGRSECRSERRYHLLDRTRKSFWYNIGIALAVNFVISMAALFTNEYWMQIFIKDDPAAIEYALIRNDMLMAATVIATMNSVLGSAIQAFGYPVCSTINAVLWVLGLRAVWMAFIYPHFGTYSNLILCFAVSWIFTFLCNVIIISVVYTRYSKGKYRKI